MLAYQPVFLNKTAQSRSIGSLVGSFDHFQDFDNLYKMFIILPIVLFAVMILCLA